MSTLNCLVQRGIIFMAWSIWQSTVVKQQANHFNIPIIASFVLWNSEYDFELDCPCHALAGRYGRTSIQCSAISQAILTIGVQPAKSFTLHSAPCWRKLRTSSALFWNLMLTFQHQQWNEMLIDWQDASLCISLYVLYILHNKDMPAATSAFHDNNNNLSLTTCVDSPWNGHGGHFDGCSFLPFK